MMKKPTYIPYYKEGSPSADNPKEIAYTPLIVIAGSETHKLALHKDADGVWCVADPKSGALVVKSVCGQYKGIRISSRGLTLKEVRQLAIADVELIISRIGSTRFNDVLATGRLK